MRIEHSTLPSDVWAQSVSGIWEASQPKNGRELAKEIQARLGLLSEKMAIALMDGIGHLIHYAKASYAAGDTVLEMEAEAVRCSRNVMRGCYEAHVQESIDALDNIQKGSCACVHCGGSTESQGRPRRTWESQLGLIELSRRYRLCPTCQEGTFMSQRVLGLPDEHFTPRLESLCTLVATTVPYEMSKLLIGELTGAHVSETALEKMIERRGEHVETREHETAHACYPYEENGLPVTEYQRPADSVERVADVAYLEMDGVLPLVREEVSQARYTDGEKETQAKAKADKVQGGKGRRYDISGREVKNAVLYSGEACAQETPGRGCLLDKRYVSFLGDWKTFALMVWVMLLRLGFDRAKRLVILSDGAEWIRSLAAWLPFNVLLILDLYHVKRRIWDVANLLYGAKTEKANQWARAQCAFVEWGKVQTVIQRLSKMSVSRKEVQAKIEELAEYLRNNQDRMDYPTYRQMGLRVGSGAVESANYHVTGSRLKLQGMRWSEEGARYMSFLRADLFNGNWNRTTKQMAAA